MKNKVKRTDASSLLPFFLFALFAICIVTVLLMGAKLYKNQTQRDRNGYIQRTVAQYVTTRIRQGDKYDSFFVGDFDEKLPKEQGNAFFFTETLGGAKYYTCIYCYEGYLYELFASADDSFEPTAGEKIMEVKNINFLYNGKELCADITYDDESSKTLVLYVRSSEGEHK